LLTRLRETAQALAAIPLIKEKETGFVAGIFVATLLWIEPWNTNTQSKQSASVCPRTTCAED